MITQAAVTVTAQTDTKIYDGTTSSSAAPLVTGIIAPDVVDAAPTQLYDNNSTGTGHIMTASGLTIKDGSNADVTANYDITYVTNTTGVITQAAVTVTAQTDTKVYDGTTSSSAAPLVTGIIAPDVVDAAPTQLYDNNSTGTGHIMTASGLTIKDGSNADVTANYDITYVTSTTGVITQAAVTVTAQTDTKVYDGTTSSSAAPLVTGIIAPDVVDAAPTQLYDNNSTGTGHIMTASGLTIKDGSNADVTANYDITYVTSTTGVITQAAVTVTAQTDTKVYDGTTSSSAAPLVTGIIAPDVVDAAPTQLYDNNSTGTGHTMTASGLTIKDGSNADVTANYDITYVTSTTGVITQAAVTVTAQTDTKVYDGTTSSSAAPLVTGIIAPDVVDAANTGI